MRRSALLPLLAATTALTLAFALPSRAAEDAVVIPAPALDAAPASGIQTAVVAGGCFWGVQGVFQHTAGVVNAVSGYAGGTKATADYQTVSTGRTGHAESVEIKYDPKKISYGKILQIYFSVAHDPTQLNRQGPDSGTQYSPPPTSRRRSRRPISPSSTAPRSSTSRS
jgi:peptide-methionine (S)-S-oxide reductase